MKLILPLILGLTSLFAISCNYAAPESSSTQTTRSTIQKPHVSTVGSANLATKLDLLYDVIVHRSNYSSTSAKNFKATVSGKDIKVTDHVVVEFYTYSWSPWDKDSRIMSAELTCKGDENIVCSSSLQGSSGIHAYLLSYQHEAKIIVNGTAIQNPVPMSNAGSDRFHIVLSMIPTQRY